MDKEALVDRDIEAGRLLLEELERAGVLVNAAMWVRMADDDRWRFHLASPDVGVRGPLEVYQLVHEAIKKLPRDAPINFSDIHVGNPANSFASTVVSTLEPSEEAGVLHVADLVVGGEKIKDAWVFPPRAPRPVKKQRGDGARGARRPRRRAKKGSRVAR